MSAVITASQRSLIVNTGGVPPLKPDQPHPDTIRKVEAVGGGAWARDPPGKPGVEAADLIVEVDGVAWPSSTWESCRKHSPDSNSSSFSNSSWLSCRLDND